MIISTDVITVYVIIINIIINIIIIIIVVVIKFGTCMLWEDRFIAEIISITSSHFHLINSHIDVARRNHNPTS